VTWKLQTLNSKCLVGLNDLIMAIFPNLRLAVSVVVYSVDYISPTLLFRRVQFEWMRCCIGIRRLKLKLKKNKSRKGVYNRRRRRGCTGTGCVPLCQLLR